MRLNYEQDSTNPVDVPIAKEHDHLTFGTDSDRLHDARKTFCQRKYKGSKRSLLVKSLIKSWSLLAIVVRLNTETSCVVPVMGASFLFAPHPTAATELIRVSKSNILKLTPNKVLIFAN